MTRHHCLTKISIDELYESDNLKFIIEQFNSDGEKCKAAILYILGDGKEIDDENSNKCDDEKYNNDKFRDADCDREKHSNDEDKINKKSIIDVNKSIALIMADTSTALTVTNTSTALAMADKSTALAMADKSKSNTYAPTNKYISVLSMSNISTTSPPTNIAAISVYYHGSESCTLKSIGTDKRPIIQLIFGNGEIVCVGYVSRSKAIGKTDGDESNTNKNSMMDENDVYENNRSETEDNYDKDSICEDDKDCKDSGDKSSKQLMASIKNISNNSSYDNVYYFGNIIIACGLIIDSTIYLNDVLRMSVEIQQGKLEIVSS